MTKNSHLTMTCQCRDIHQFLTVNFYFHQNFFFHLSLSCHRPMEFWLSMSITVTNLTRQYANFWQCHCHADSWLGARLRKILHNFSETKVVEKTRTFKESDANCTIHCEANIMNEGVEGITLFYVLYQW